MRIENNLLNQWTSWDMLNVLPSLKKLRSKGNPLFTGMQKSFFCHELYLNEMLEKIFTATIHLETNAEEFAPQVAGRVKGLTVIDGNTVRYRKRKKVNVKKKNRN